MSKQKRQRSFDFGRVFFPDKTNPIPDVIYFQPLGNHVCNVRKLVKAWKVEDFPGITETEREESKARVDEAARIHDIGKPPKFKLEAKATKEGKFKEYIYSFKGHRFLADSPDIWAKYLAIGHHDFSVGDISRDAYKLKKESQEYEQILTREPLTYGRELYILEMCDQIEAELACRVIGNDEQAESRAFMDYTTFKLDNSTYLIDPFPFNFPFNKDEISLSFAYWSLKLSEEDKKELGNLLDKPHKLEDKINNIVKEWWQSHQGKAKKEPHQGKAKEENPKRVGIKSHSLVDSSQDWNCETAYQALSKGKYISNPMQQDVWDAIANPNPAFLLKAPTGSGKMEAVLFPCLAKGYRLILPLPSRSLVEDQKQRIERYIKTFSALPENKDLEFSLVVDTGSQMERLIYQNGERVERKINSRRHLYKGDVILTTLDKFLYRYFAFGDKQKSFVFPLRIHRDKTHSEKTLICVDEAHSYDNISFTNFHSLVQSLYEAGRSIVLMTATMPQQHLDRFDYLKVIDYINNLENVNSLREFQQQSYETKAFEWLNEVQRDSTNPLHFQTQVAQIVLREWKSKSNRRIIAVVETVTDAVEIYTQVKNELAFNTDTQGQFLFLYHGRISDIPKDSEFSRSTRYKNLKNRDENHLPYILITTSAIEVGCDLNSEVLISEMCPPENLIQRAGRCNRRGNVPNAKVILVGNTIQEFANTLDESGWETYTETLQKLTDFNTAKISECILRSQQVDDYRVVELFSMLHDYVYSADLACQPAHEKGLVVTRSWTPSATLVYDDGTHGDKIENMPQVTVPIDRLTIKKDKSNQYANTHVYERYYDQEKTSWERRDLRWGFAYQKDIIIKIHRSNDGASMLDGNPEYSYEPELGFVKLPGVFIKLKTNGFDEKLLYQYGNTAQKKSVIITYTKALEETT
ncbi:MAG: CRISPR-associated helicase Cas3' [Microcoleus sp. PH2017_40_RAT_O_B]|uniref:CRISPR-associated helicase Cas3' n=1 Tax=unclassified Microcoleus TaxID=2642155 RepID=UPI001DB451BD|nr:MULTISPECIES: CRISPR-associated helicase Cas3' [unclassified Microcoleus]TAF85542.1 MAG: CRISPR-associated helicase Cas3' [Oscillatoriales cyanobacterium]MCC3450865.1 CRISPR-associated helicase Cas3' [Microcoleus sp. PH2017_09_SFU_O_A]MCC3573203.1 CRISPR-associated helicase Cas3' [Microcoleus sp. PH2017_34_RAT_O_A]MCC3583220.1 CRISPR-associated helicase Cas3' [Microcoleus sp. PH2017_30_WIL_O_A]MCC3610631.1 CRISPR-associated helicase Cas3' [Microcoleus sp. PH2017_40_RAT_O_B]